MTKYHINPETKEVGKCVAEYNCRYGSDSPHFNDMFEAHQEAEKQLEEAFGTFGNSVSKYNSNSVEIPDNHTFETLTKTERNWKTPEEHFEIGNIIRYEGDVHTVNDLDTTYNYAENEYDYHIYTDDGRDITISEWAWKHSSSLDIEKLAYNYDEVPVPPGSSGAKLSDYVSPGDTIKYNDEMYVIEDFEYNRAILAYEIETDKGVIQIGDDDWYHNASPNIFVQKG